MGDPVRDFQSCDSVRKPLHVIALWVVPGGIPAAAFLGAMQIPTLLLPGAATCAVMDIACLVNAARCHRLHCYLTGPYFLLISLAAGVAFVLDTGNTHHSREWLLVALCIAPLLIWLPERLTGTTYHESAICRTRTLSKALLIERALFGLRSQLQVDARERPLQLKVDLDSYRMSPSISGVLYGSPSLLKVLIRN